MKKAIVIVSVLAALAAIIYIALSYNKTSVARINLSTNLVNKSVPQFEVYVDGAETQLNQAGWMPTYNIQGYVVNKDGKDIDIVIKPLTDTKISVSLLGPYELDKNNKVIENWVNFTSFTVNDQEVLSEAVEAWHNKPFVYTIDAKNGDEYKVHIKWTKSSK